MSPHSLNIVVHVTAGCLAIGLGLVLLMRRKGDGFHRALGRVTVGVAGVSMAAALIGALVFRGKADLIGVSILVSYHLWAGVRALRLKANGRGMLDVGPALGVVVAAGALWWASRAGGAVNWEPGRVYAAVGGLTFYGGWDVVRTVFPAAWRRWLNPAEHGFRMTSLVGALVSVAVATLWPARADYSALGLSAVFAMLAGALAVRAALRAAR